MSLNSDSSIYDNVDRDEEKSCRRRIFLVDNCTLFSGLCEQHQFSRGNRIGWKIGSASPEIFSCSAAKTKCRYHKTINRKHSSTNFRNVESGNLLKSTNEVSNI